MTGPLFSLEVFIGNILGVICRGLESWCPGVRYMLHGHSHGIQMCRQKHSQLSQGGHVVEEVRRKGDDVVALDVPE